MSAIVPAVSLHCKKYFSLGHKHLAPGNRVAKQERFSLSENFCAKNVFSMFAIVPAVQCINIPLRVIELQNKKGFHLAVYNRAE
jgi:hypothetical protein